MNKLYYFKYIKYKYKYLKLSLIFDYKTNINDNNKLINIIVDDDKTKINQDDTYLNKYNLKYSSRPINNQRKHKKKLSKLKKLIFKKIYDDLADAEVIEYGGNIWFIKREDPYFYLEYEHTGVLWYDWDFFKNFFSLFSMNKIDFQPIILDDIQQEDIQQEKIKEKNTINRHISWEDEQLPQNKIDVLEEKINTIFQLLNKIDMKLEKMNI